MGSEGGDFVVEYKGDMAVNEGVGNRGDFRGLR